MPSPRFPTCTAPAFTAAEAHAQQRHTGDVHEQAGLLTQWQQDYAQLSGGTFEGQVQELWLGDLHLFVEDTNRRLLQRGALPPGQLALGLPLALGAGTVRFCGDGDWQGPAQAARFCSFSGSEGFEFITPEGLCMAGIALPLHRLQTLAHPSQQAALAHLAGHAGLHAADPARLQALRTRLAATLQLAVQQPALLQAPGAAQTLRDDLLTELLGLLPEVDAAAPALAPRASALVARAQTWLRDAAEADEPPGVAELCEAMGVSRRTLQAAFQQCTGLAPAAFLRSLRLSAARRALREARSVAEAATSQGFWQLGQFAQDYRQLFGELPSQTWKRWHGESRGALH